MRFIVTVFLLFLPVLILAETGEGPQTTPAVVKGDVLYLEEDYVVMKEMSGREVRMRVNAETKIEGVAGKLKTGDKIHANVAPDGHALSITLQIPESGSTSIAPGSR